MDDEDIRKDDEKIENYVDSSDECEDTGDILAAILAGITLDDTTVKRYASPTENMLETAMYRRE